MARIVGYIASSLDGFIAAADESLEWLTPRYDALNDGSGEDTYASFIADIRTTVMGRTTYEWIRAHGSPSPYPDKRTIVVTSTPISDLPPEVETWHDGVDTLVAHLRALDDGPVWMVGGGKLQMAFLERDALDEIEIFLMPEIIGGGYPMFPATGLKRTPRLLSAGPLKMGCVRLRYAFD